MSSIVPPRVPLRVGDEPIPVREVAHNGAGDVFALPELDLHMAKCQLGGAIKSALVKTDSAMKEFGTPAVVERMCRGELSDALGRIWARPDTREEFVLALVKASGLFDVETRISRRRAG